MKELNDIEVTCVSGGTLSGMIVGAVDGAATGMAIGGNGAVPAASASAHFPSWSAWSCQPRWALLPGARSVSSPMQRRLSVTWANTGKTSVPVM